MKKSLLLMFVALLLVNYSILLAQKVNFSNNQIQFTVQLNKQSDSLFVLNRTIINKTNDVIYVPLYGGEYTFIRSRKVLTIKTGCLRTDNYTMDAVFVLTSLNPKDTLNNSLTISFDSIPCFNQIFITFDYATPALLSKSESREFKNNLGLITEPTSIYYFIKDDIYMKYCESLNFSINYNEP